MKLVISSRRPYLTERYLTILPPPHIHLRNAAERPIQTFKDNFIAGLSSTDPGFIPRWDLLLPKTIMILNISRTSHTNPKLSSYANIVGIQDFNWYPLSPPSNKLMMNKNTDNRRSWYPHDTYGWYIGPSMEHYIRVNFFMPYTSSFRNVDTIIFLPAAISIPKTKTEYYP